MPRSNSLADSLTTDDEVIPLTHVPNDQYPGHPRESPTHRPIDRFRMAARQIIAMNRTHRELDAQQVSALARIQWRHQNCTFQIWEYGATRARVWPFDTNASFLRWFNEEMFHQRPLWSRVRWIHVNGLSHDILKPLAERFELHPLAIDTVVNGRDNARSKADYYPGHLFVHIVNHVLAADDFPGHGLPASDSESSFGRPKRLKQRPFDEFEEDADHIKVDVMSVFMFLLQDGTLITIQRDPKLEFGDPIFRQLRVHSSTLRSSADASFLLYSLLDLIVDNAVQITDQYQTTLDEMKRDIRFQPRMRTGRLIHTVAGNLKIYRRMMGAIAELVDGLRRYDTDRSKAVLPPDASRGFLSDLCKLYLADVHGHIEYAVQSLEMLSAMAEDLFNYTFTLVSYETNKTMGRLTIATMIFFPLTFLSGYFGMNLQMPFLSDHSDSLFWIIAIPMMILMTSLLMWTDLVQWWRRVKWQHWQRVEHRRQKQQRAQREGRGDESPIYSLP